MYRRGHGARTVGLAMCLAVSLAVGSIGFAQGQSICDCWADGECTYEACCFVNNDCLPNDKLCKRVGSSPPYSCEYGAACTYEGPCCEPEGCMEG
jgi:hypothetical protein